MLSQLSRLLHQPKNLPSSSGGRGTKSAPGTPAPSSVKTGGSKTRLNSQPASNGIAVSIDWLQFTGAVLASKLYQEFESLQQVTGEKLKLELGKPTMCGRVWANSGKSPNGIKVAWDNEIDRQGKSRCFISIPARVLSALEPEKISFLARHLKFSGFRCSRIDIAVDDFKKRLKKEKVIKAIKMKNFSKFENRRLNDSLDDGGWTIYMGNRESARFTRLYDKDTESKGEIKSTRLETQFNAKTANIVLDEWLAIDPQRLGENWEKASAKYLFQSVVGSIDFVDRASNPDEKNVSRLKRLNWWAQFCKLAEGTIYHTAPVPKQSLQKAVGWMKRQVLKSMKCVSEALGEEAFTKWLEYGLNSAGTGLSSWHKKRMQQFTAEWEMYKDTVDYGVPGMVDTAAKPLLA